MPGQSQIEGQNAACQRLGTWRRRIWYEGKVGNPKFRDYQPIRSQAHIPDKPRVVVTPS